MFKLFHDPNCGCLDLGRTRAALKSSLERNDPKSNRRPGRSEPAKRHGSMMRQIDRSMALPLFLEAEKLELEDESVDEASCATKQMDS